MFFHIAADYWGAGVFYGQLYPRITSYNVCYTKLLRFVSLFVGMSDIPYLILLPTLDSPQPTSMAHPEGLEPPTY